MKARNGDNPHFALLRWWDANRRDLPWRRSRDPYRVWLSEVMLQQTRVEVVIPAYRRFLRALPTLARLAEADEDTVLSLWSGLGYYSRARALHRAASELNRRRRRFPRTMEEARELPGVGAYTAAAVLSIAYGEPHAAIDGNIARVLARLFRAPRAEQTLADDLLARDRPGDWNQALMELGQRICTPKSPACDECPLSSHCEARRCGDVALFPQPKRRRATERVELRLTVVRDRKGRVLLERGAFPHLTHMWLPLTRDARPATRDFPRGRFRHAILHRQFEVTVGARVATPAEMKRLLRAAGGAERRLFTAGELAAIGRSSLLTKAMAHVGA